VSAVLRLARSATVAVSSSPCRAGSRKDERKGAGTEAAARRERREPEGPGEYPAMRTPCRASCSDTVGVLGGTLTAMATHAEEIGTVDTGRAASALRHAQQVAIRELVGADANAAQFPIARHRGPLHADLVDTWLNCVPLCLSTLQNDPHLTNKPGMLVVKYFSEEPAERFNSVIMYLSTGKSIWHPIA